MTNPLIRRILAILPLVILFLLVHALIQHFKISGFFLILLCYVAALALYLVALRLIMFLPSKRFDRDMGYAIRTFNKNKDGQTFYDSLLALKERATTPVRQCTLNMNLSTALFYMERYEESLEYLDKIQTSDERVKKIVQRQRADIRKKLED